MFKWLLTIVLMLSGLGILQSQSVIKQKEILQKRLPEEAQVLKNMGNHWYKIKLRGQILLYHFKGSDKGGYESITKIEEESPLAVNRISPDNIPDIHNHVIEELPLNSQIVEILGHGWYFIEQDDGKIYLYHLTSYQHGAKCITLLKE